MSNTDKDITYTLKGERAAMGGYLAQYDTFAIGIYDAMEAGTLEEIRVADMEENVGKLDDVVYATTDKVFAYQIKWSTDDDKTIAYPAFKELIKQAVEGWRKLKQLYPDKTIIPHLLTNRTLTEGDYTINALAGKNSGGFRAYVEGVLSKLGTGEAIDNKWDNALAELRQVTGLYEREWDGFWRVFRFLPDYKQEIVEVRRIEEDQRTYDIICLYRMIQEMAGREGFEIRLTVKEIISRLKWAKRFETTFDHNLNVPEDSYVPNAHGITLLNKAMQGKSKGYVFLKGSPGSGKSTLLTQWARNIHNPSVRFYAFDFLNPSSQKNNDYRRGSGLAFLHDIVLLIHKTGVEGNRTILPNQDYSVLQDRFYRQMDEMSTTYKQTGKPYVIIIDGLDHITREYTECQETLMKVLPAPVDIPEGVIFVLGSQHFDNLKLNRAIEKESRTIGNLIEMPPLSQEESESLCQKLLAPKLITNKVLERCWNKSHGHPLYLRYLLNHIATVGEQAVDNLDDTPEGVEDYYARIVGEKLDKYSVKDALGLVARITGNILLDDVRALCTEDSLMDIKNGMWHLFRYDEGGQSLSFFHNSFRQYLLDKTAEDALTGNYSKTKDIDYYKRLAEHFKNGWEKGYYLYNAEQYDDFLELLTPDYLFRQAQNYRPLWSIQRDLRRGVEIARRRRDPYLLVRYLLFENQLTQMDNQDLSVLSLAEDFIHTGRSTLAKAVVREDRQLHCSQHYALELAVAYLKVGDKDEANLLFTLSYPEFLSHKPEEHHNRYRDLQNKEEYLTEWVKTAGYFMEWTDIEKQIAIFIPYLELFAQYDDENFDGERFIRVLFLSYLNSLIAQNRWKEFEAMVQSTSNDTSYVSTLFRAYDNAIIRLSNDNGSVAQLSQYFVEIEKLFATMPQRDITTMIMANLAQRSNQPTKIITDYLNKINWSGLGTFYQSEVGQKFETLQPFIFYVKTRAAYGYNDSMTMLVPDNPEHKDNDLMVNYARRVFSIAQMSGKAKAGIKEYSFLPLITHSLRYFDTLESPLPDHNRYAYTIAQQRKDFYEFVIKMAKDFGDDIVEKVAYSFDKYFSENDCKADGAVRRKVVMTLFREGFDHEWCKRQLAKVDELMMNWKDLDGRVSESLEQGEAWLEMACYDRAEEYFHQMIEETFGVGYRKDAQPSVFAEWLGNAMQRDPDHAMEYAHWLTSRLRHIDEIAETRTTYRAAHELLYRTFRYNLRSGLKMASWMLDEEFEYYQSVSTVILNALLKRAETPEEYHALISVYEDLHLYLDENDAYDLGTSLLQAFVVNGQRILGSGFHTELSKLRQKIKTECPENIVEGMLTALEEKLHPEAKQPDKDQERERYKVLATAKRLRIEGHADEAWGAAVQALSDSNASGWARFYDGGSRIDICQELQEIDKERGREFALDLFASDIPVGYSYGAIQYLDEIVPLLTDKIDFERLFAEELTYMNRILREDTCNDKDKPEIAPDTSSVCELLRDWLLLLAKMPVVCVAERAKMLLAKIYDETGVSVLEVLPNDVHAERMKLEIGCYMAELKSAHLSDFREVAQQEALSSNYQYRLYANKILHALGEHQPQIPRKTLPAVYDLVFSPSESESLSWIPGKESSTDIDWKDASSVMGVASHWSGYLSYCTGIDQRTLEYRALELMKKYGDTGKGNVNKDKAINRHYDRISLRCPYRKVHADAALDGMLEVASELMDGGTVNGRYFDGWFISRDFANILIESRPRPDFIQRIGSPDEWIVKDNWITKAWESPRLKETLPKFEGFEVIGEYTHLKKMGDNPAMEEYESKISFSEGAPKDRGTSIFSESPFMKLTSNYLNMGQDDPEAILLRGGYYTDFSNKSHWIAINPAMAFSIGWKPSKEGHFAWINGEGEKMVESIYWQSGNTNVFTRSHYETGEGWIVVASKEALAAIREIAPLYVHKKVMRRRGDNPADMTHQVKKVEKLI